MTARKWPTKPTAAKYRTREHRQLRAQLVRRLNAGEQLQCTAELCVFDRAPIVNPDGRARDGLHLGHEPDGITYAGPQHRQCNIEDGARRGNERRHAQPFRRDW